MLFSDKKGYLKKPDFSLTEKVSLPTDTKIICDYAFEQWHALKEITLPEGLKVIGSNAFKDCSNLEKINLPSSLSIIEDSAFNGCISLPTIEIPDNVDLIKEITFCDCHSLERIILSPNITSIGDFAFKNCYKLADIKIPNSTERIGMFAFSHCEKLKTIHLPENIKEINKFCFSACTSLQKIAIPPKVTYIGEYAFCDCKNLEEIFLPSSIKTIEKEAFSSCNKVEKITLGNPITLVQPGIKNCIDELNYAYLDTTTKEIAITRHPLQDKNTYSKINYKEIKDCLNTSTSEAILLSTFLSLKDIKTEKLYFLGPITAHLFKEENYKELIKNIKNNKEFNNLYKKLSLDIYFKNSLLSDSNIEIYNLFKLAYALGGFSPNQIERQKACEYISNLFDKNIINIYDINKISDELKLNCFNKEWAEFVMNKNNTAILFSDDFIKSKYIAKSYNEFQNIKELARSNKGSQRYHKITIEACQKYLKKTTFEGITPQTEDIAKTLDKFTKNQKSFTEAKEIREEFLSLQKQNLIKDHLLEQILIAEKEIISNLNDTLSNLKETSKNKFTYEFLSKNDAVNFVLGKYCSCCSHIEATGYGIMKASILHPDCQNLVIRNEQGTIIAKSTLYINRKEGYGLFNTIEVSEDISIEEKKSIYEKYIKAVSKFIEKYNEQNPQTPLKQINVGMRANDLSLELEKHNKKSPVILKGLDFSLYGKPEYTHIGDWKQEQRIVWPSKKTTK